MRTAIRTPVNTALRDEWLQTIAELKNRIRDWVLAEPGWAMYETETNPVAESPLGEYAVTVSEIHTPEGEARLEPIARNYPGHGIVELFAWPTLYRVRLIQDDSWGGWRVRTDSGISLRQEWNRKNFIVLVRDLIHADA